MKKEERREEKKRRRARHGPAVALKDLPRLRRVRPWRERAEKNSSFIDKLGEGISAVLGAEDEIEGEVAAKEAAAVSRV